MDNFTVLPLGSNGWMPVDGRETVATLVRIGDDSLLLDLGSGIRRLSDPRALFLLKGARRVTIFLSHYHLDHLFGLIFLPGLLAGRDVTLAGPGPELSGASLRPSLEILTSFPFFSHDLDGFPMNLNLLELLPGSQSVGNLTVTARRQDHTQPSTGIRINDALAYCTDTATQDETADLARGCDLLIHEAWLDNAHYDESLRTNALTGRGHSHASGAARLAASASVKRLSLIHLNPFYPPARLASMQAEAQAVFPQSHLMNDLEMF